MAEIEHAEPEHDGERDQREAGESRRRAGEPAKVSADVDRHVDLVRAGKVFDRCDRRDRNLRALRGIDGHVF